MNLTDLYIRRDIYYQDLEIDTEVIVVGYRDRIKKYTDADKIPIGSTGKIIATDYGPCICKGEKCNEELCKRINYKCYKPTVTAICCYDIMTLNGRRVIHEPHTKI
jgi:hypothetical protein